MSTTINESDIKSRNEPDSNQSGTPQNWDVFDIEDQQHSLDKQREPENSFCIQPYISKRGAVYLGQYKYKCEDISHSYTLFFAPLSNLLARYTPKTLAPSFLTLFGFAHALLPPVLGYIALGSSLVGEMPAWLIYMQTWCYFVYRISDNLS